MASFELIDFVARTLATSPTVTVVRAGEAFQYKQEGSQHFGSAGWYAKSRALGDVRVREQWMGGTSFIGWTTARSEFYGPGAVSVVTDSIMREAPDRELFVSQDLEWLVRAMAHQRQEASHRRNETDESMWHHRRREIDQAHEEAMAVARRRATAISNYWARQAERNAAVARGV